MSAARRGRRRKDEATGHKRDFARSALAFGRAGGCSAGCKNCRFYVLCVGGNLGGEEEQEREKTTEEKCE